MVVNFSSTPDSWLVMNDLIIHFQNILKLSVWNISCVYFFSAHFSTDKIVLVSVSSWFYPGTSVIILRKFLSNRLQRWYLGLFYMDVNFYLNDMRNFHQREIVVLLKLNYKIRIAFPIKQLSKLQCNVSKQLNDI